MCVCVCVCVCFHIIPYVHCFDRTVHYMCTEYCISVNKSHVSTLGIDERMINVHYYYYYYTSARSLTYWSSGLLLLYSFQFQHFEDPDTFKCMLDYLFP